MRPIAQKLLVVTSLGVCLLAFASLLRREAAPKEQAAGKVAATAKNPRLLIRRFWFDRLPEKRGDEVDAWLFLGGGIGLEERGSTFRFGIDFFEFERQGSKAEIMWFHDKKKQAVSFEIVECHDKPPFDVCLNLKEPLRGQQRLWSFDDDADMDANVPWAREWMTSSEARVRTLR